MRYYFYGNNGFCLECGEPILWYVKDAYPMGRGFLRDGIEINNKDGQNKEMHKWQQSIDWCEYYISKLTKENDVVLDPYCGSGTVPLICKKLNRNYIGIDINESYCEIARNRLNGIS